MLKGIDPILTPDVLHAMCSMGHGDELVLVDANFPADTAARATIVGKVLRLDGVDAPRAMRAILSLLVLDSSDSTSVERIQVDNDPQAAPHVVKEVQIEIESATGSFEFGLIPRKEFYQRAKKSYCVIATGESRPWGCFILRKGVDLAADLPRTEGKSSTGQWTK